MDSFSRPSPTHGERILRVFCNVNPSGKPRVWKVGEPFEKVAERFLAGRRPPIPGKRGPDEAGGHHQVDAVRIHTTMRC